MEIQQALRTPQLEATTVADAMGASARALVAVVVELTNQIGRLESELGDRFEQHPDAKIIRSLPGLGMILGARVLGEFGDDPNRYADAKSRKNYAGTSPITKASGRVVLARYARNRNLADACHLWASAPSRKALEPGPSTAPAELPKTHTTKHFGPSATASSASSTAASDTALPTTSTPPGPTDSKQQLDEIGTWDV